MDFKEKYIIWKKWGETPLSALERLRKHLDISLSVPMTYAGRLDPAVEGLLVILVGEECKKKDSYTLLSKTYQAEILLGVSTDSFDLLGVPKVSEDADKISAEILSAVEEYLKKSIGTKMQSYPPYSSKTVNGKQMHEHTRNGSDIEIPTHEVNLFSYENLKIGTRMSTEIIERVNELTKIVEGDFRQAKIAQSWQDISKILPEKMQTISVSLSVSSGFYIRQFAEDLGKYLGIGACLYLLVRTKIGDYTKVDCEL